MEQINCHDMEEKDDPLLSGQSPESLSEGSGLNDADGFTIIGTS